MSDFPAHDVKLTISTDYSALGVAHGKGLTNVLGSACQTQTEQEKSWKNFLDLCGPNMTKQGRHYLFPCMLYVVNLRRDKRFSSVTGGIIENGQWSADQDAQKKADTSLGSLLQTAEALDVKAKYLAHSRPRSYAKLVRRIRITRPA
eukprot:scaffold132086_cov73-Cyclotella_meneghiniana.AAC.1